MAYILVIYLKLGYGQEALQFQEFSSQTNCQHAIAVIHKLKTDAEHLECIPK